MALIRFKPAKVRGRVHGTIYVRRFEGKAAKVPRVVGHIGSIAVVSLTLRGGLSRVSLLIEIVVRVSSTQGLIWCSLTTCQVRHPARRPCDNEAIPWGAAVRNDVTAIFLVDRERITFIYDKIFFAVRKFKRPLRLFRELKTL